MNSKARELFCVGCQLPVRAAPSAAPAGVAARLPPASANRCPLQTAGDGAPSAAEQEERKEEEKENEKDDEAKVLQGGAAAANRELPAWLGRTAQGREKYTDTAMPMSQEVSACVACVLRRMSEARTALDSSSARSEMCGHYLAVLRHCAEALAALRRVP